MPKLTFECEACGNKQAFYVSVETKEKTCSKCTDGVMRQKMPFSSPPIVRELINPYTNVHLPPDNSEILEARRSEYFWKVEVPRLVNEYPLEECLKQGWLVYNEKGELVIQTKPPYKR